MNYNPFNKPLDDIEYNDLERLITNSITEGWFVEYKSNIPRKGSKIDSAKIAKSVSSFANTKGGWLFFGIESDNRNLPSNICGIDISNFNNFEDQMSQIITSNISPYPVFHFKIVEVEDKKVVFIIHVESSPTPPYITSQGVIYQRENNESNPIRDRYILEKLNEKTDKYYSRIEEFSNFDLGETRGQSENQHSFLELYLFPIPFGGYRFERFYHSEFFKEVSESFYKNLNLQFSLKGIDSQVALNIGFNSIYSSEKSLIIRPLNEDDLIFKSTTVELFDNGNLKFTIPLMEFGTNNYPDHYKDSEILRFLLDKYCPIETIEDYGIPGMMKYDKPLLKEERKISGFSSHVRFIDGADLIFYVMIIVAKYREILKINNYNLKESIGFRARVTDVWRRFVFFDSSDYLEKIKLYNIPLSPKDDIEIPTFTNGDSYKICLDEVLSEIEIAKYIIEGIGIPDSASLDYEEILGNSLKRFSEKKN